MPYKPLIEPMYLVEMESVSSTNDQARKLAKNGYPSGVIIWAHEQTAGRGRQGNSWVSIPGNLFMTIILRPHVNVAQIGQLSLLAGVALANVLGSFVPATNDIRLKWPNDLYINGKKAAGILVETESQGMLSVPWAVVGIGVNIVSAPENATSLFDIGISTYEAGHVLEFLSKEIHILVKQWEQYGFAPIRDAWMERAFKLGETITARLPKGELTGIFEGLDKTGALLLTATDGARHTVNAGEVFV